MATPTPDFVMINNYLIDVAIREDHVFENDVTDNPVESGGTISDNIRPRPIRVTMDGIVSNSPLGNIATSRRTFAGPLSTGQASVQEAYALLLAVWNAREPVAIRTSLGTFERMALLSLSIPRDAKTGDALHFTAQFQQIQVVSNNRIRTRTSLRPGAGGGKRDRGPQPTVARSERLILWRKGRPPGGVSRITEVEVIYYIEDNSPEATRLKSTSSVTGVVGLGKYYHADKKTLLDNNELIALQKDLERDRRLKIPEVGRNADNRAATSDLIDGRLFSKNGNLYVTQTPFNNMSEAARRPPVDAPNFSGAPNFNPSRAGTLGSLSSF